MEGFTVSWCPVQHVVTGEFAAWDRVGSCSLAVPERIPHILRGTSILLLWKETSLGTWVWEQLGDTEPKKMLCAGLLRTFIARACTMEESGIARTSVLGTLVSVAHSWGWGPQSLLWDVVRQPAACGAQQQPHRGGDRAV